MTFETAIGYVLSFILGAVVALFWAYSGLSSRLSVVQKQIGEVNFQVLDNEVKGLKAIILSFGLINLVADVKTMKDSIIFDRDFQQKLAIICSEHKEMHDQVEINKGELHDLKTVLDIKTK